MTDKNLNDLKKKHRYIGIKLSRDERKQIEDFCKKNDISISNMVRYSVKKVINEKSVN